MTAPARNALGKLIGQSEVTFRTAPTPGATVLPFTSFGVERKANRQENNTINQSALREKTDQGDPTVDGPISSIFDLRTIGFWLKNALGAATVGKAVTVQPTNVTGVTIHYASSDATTGNGTLTFASAGSTLAWAVASGSAGTPVDVSGGGVFTLESNGGGKSITVTVIPALLPGGNQNDANIAVSGSLKAHVFPINTTLRPSALLEMQHSDISKYYRYLGCKVNNIGGDILGNEQNISLDIVAGYEVDPVPSSAFDGSATAYTAVRACSGKGGISDGTTGLGTVIAGNWRFGNNLDPLMTGDELEGPGFIDNGELTMGGEITSLFNGGDAYALARAGTSTRLRLVSAAVNGSNTFKLTQDYWNVELVEKAPAKEGRSGLRATTTWRAHRSAYSPIIVLVNDVTAY